MKTIIALLLGLISCINARQSFSFDSNDNADGDTTSYDGFVFTVSKSDGQTPEVRFSTDLDDHDTTICFDLTRLFESEDYPEAATEDPTYTVLEGTEVKFEDAGCTINEDTMDATSFEIVCDSVGEFGALIATFNFIANNEDAKGNTGLEYTIKLGGYQFISELNTTKLIIEQTLTDCSDEYSYSADGDDSDGDSNGDDEEEDDEETDGETDEEDEETENTETDRRRLLNSDDEETDDADSDSADESDGVSSDDSNEIDVGVAEFLLTGTAYDVCYENGVESSRAEIGKNLVFIKATNAVQIVFDNFDCELELDPWISFDEEKVADKAKENDDSVGSMGFVVAICVGLIATFL